MSLLRLLRQAAVAVACIAGTFVVLTVSGAVLLPRLMGWEVYTVTSGSMEPTISTGSVVAVKPVDPDQLRVRDVITYRVNGSTELVTHRVIHWSGRGAERTFQTQGDANESPDPGAVSAAALVGEVQFGVSYVGIVVDQLVSPLGAGLAAGLIALALLAGGSKPNGRTDDVTPNGELMMVSDATPKPHVIPTGSVETTSTGAR